MQEDQAWLDYRARFAEHYDDRNYSSPLQSRVMHAGHRLCEREFPPSDRWPRVLEVGAGTGVHLDFVRHGFDRYTVTDLDAHALEAASGRLPAALRDRVVFDAQDATRLNYADDSFDRLVAVHVLEHLPSPHMVLKEWSRVVRPGGILTILIPTDPGLAWRLGRHLGPRRSAMAQGLAYDYVMAREHINSCVNLAALLRHYFPERREAWWPLRLPSTDLNLFHVCHAVNPNRLP